MNNIINKNIGIILPNLDLNQLAFEVIYTINREISNGSKDDYRIFFEELSTRCLDPMFATMNIAEIYSYEGVLISTTLDNTRMNLKTIGNTKKVFLVWDLEFIRKEKDFLENIQIYRNPDLFLIARSIEHAQAIQNYSNRVVDLVMPKLSFEGIKNVATATNRKNNRKL